jgi:hypothetical protein
MRRICLILLLSALGAPAAAFALPQPPGDGSLAVSGGSGALVVKGRGVIFGSFAQGTLVVLAYRPDNPGDTLTVSGASVRTDAGVTTYSGSQVRFLVPSGRYTLELIATGINVSAVGRGTAGASADGVLSAGSLALDGAKPLPFAQVTGPQVFGGRSGP